MADEVVEAVVEANVQKHRKKPLSAKSFNKKVVVSFARSPSILFDDNNVEDDDLVELERSAHSHCSGGGDRIEIRDIDFFFVLVLRIDTTTDRFHICSVDTARPPSMCSVPLFFCLLFLLCLVINQKCHQF